MKWCVSCVDSIRQEKGQPWILKKGEEHDGQSMLWVPWDLEVVHRDGMQREI